jgi:16S rRNA (guanine(966)-N(2))-methyltransferase RsmD
MRIISGKCRGLNLSTLKGDNTRPTLDRVKESVFNILGNKLDELVVLDLFAGSGALGLESLSRGAKFCYFVDSSKEAIDIIKKNVAKCRVEDKSEILNNNFEIALEKFKDNIFDLVFLDPPYGKDLGVQAISKLKRVVKDDVIIVLETDSIDIVPDTIDCFEKYDSRKYGRVIISFYRKAVL